MFGSSFQFVLVNTTTVENLSRRTKVWTLAIYMPNPPTSAPTSFQTITYPLTAQPRPSSSNTNGPPVPAPPPRMFAILHSKPGENPWDLGPWSNFRSVMGEKWWDCILPLKYSPCCDHDRGDSAFEMGPVVDRMRERAGIAVPRDGNGSTMPSRRRQRRSRRGDEDKGGISRSHMHKKRGHSEHRRSVPMDEASEEQERRRPLSEHRRSVHSNGASEEQEGRRPLSEHRRNVHLIGESEKQERRSRNSEHRRSVHSSGESEQQKRRSRHSEHRRSVHTNGENESAGDAVVR